jgi:hypothetical protein
MQRKIYSIVIAGEGRKTGTSASFDYLQAWPTGLSRLQAGIKLGLTPLQDLAGRLS